jgi:glucokinase
MDQKKIVVDIGGTKIRAGLWDGLTLSEVTELATPKVNSNEFTHQLVQFLSPYMDQNKVTSVHIACAGPINVKLGCIVGAVNLGNQDNSWHKYPLRDSIQNQIQRPVHLDNDAALAAWGYCKHFLKNTCSDLVVITLGTGLGVGAVIDGQLARAGQGFHPELGHIPLQKSQFNVSASSLKGYLTAESLLAGHHFATHVSERLGTTCDGKQLIQLSQNEPESMKPIWQDYVEHMSQFLSHIFLVYMPEKIIFAGGFAQAASPYFLTQARSRTQEQLAQFISQGFQFPDIELASEPDLLPLYGAAYLD